MSKAISRNEPCPCGSGKKYKACCLNKESRNPSDHLWRQLRRVDEGLLNPLLTYARKAYGEQVLNAAWVDFINNREGKSFDIDSPDNQVFIPWFLYNWLPINYVTEDDNPQDESLIYTVAESFLESFGWKLSEMERRFIKVCCSKELSFHEVVDCKPGIGFTLRDILLENEMYVTERSASQSVQKSDILFARVIKYDHVGLMIGCAPLPIPPSYKPHIIDLRALMCSKSAKLGDVEIAEWADDIRDLYLEICDAMHRPPKLSNTDGDPISFHEMTFELRSPPIAFEKLKSLALDVAEDRLLEEAEFDGNGNLRKVEFPWIKKTKSKVVIGNYTTLGHVLIEDNRLTASTNSANRAIRLRKEIEKRLGDLVTHQATEVKSLDELDAETDDTQDELSPELKSELEAALDESLAARWQNWIDEEIPALGGATPRQAVKDKNGREKVIALLDDFERREMRDHKGLNQLKHIQRVRKKLGLG